MECGCNVRRPLLELHWLSLYRIRWREEGLEAQVMVLWPSPLLLLLGAVRSSLSSPSEQLTLHCSAYFAALATGPRLSLLYNGAGWLYYAQKKRPDFSTRWPISAAVPHDDLHDIAHSDVGRSSDHLHTAVIYRLGELCKPDPEKGD